VWLRCDYARAEPRRAGHRCADKRERRERKRERERREKGEKRVEERERQCVWSA
jgi:hypothetical protein